MGQVETLQVPGVTEAEFAAAVGASAEAVRSAIDAVDGQARARIDVAGSPAFAWREGSEWRLARVIVRLQPEHLQAMIDHALRDAPVEACGLLSGLHARVEAVHPARNTEASPYRFNIDPLAFKRLSDELDDRGREIVGFYHSHTGSEARPSPTDIRMMSAFFGPPYAHFVIGVADREKPHARVFYIEDGAATEHAYELTGA
jgi:proteasome lid subunit RPN8/RPN11